MKIFSRCDIVTKNESERLLKKAKKANGYFKNPKKPIMIMIIIVELKMKMKLILKMKLLLTVELTVEPIVELKVELIMRGAPHPNKVPPIKLR